VPETKTKTEARKDAPTEAQLTTLAALADELGVEHPVIATAAEAQSAIEALQELTSETEPEPEPTTGERAGRDRFPASGLHGAEDA
jgi:hypothetical protein